MTELGEELLSYHRDEDYKIIRLRDDLISAVRYAFMERYKGKLLDGCEPHGRAPGIAGEYDPRPVRLVAPQPTQFARGNANHPDGESTFHRTALMSGSYANSLDLGNCARALSGTQAGRLQLPSRFRSV